MTLLSLLFGELAIWLGALAVWLWPAYVRHRLMWGLWFWLHPETPASIAEKPRPESLTEYVARTKGIPAEQWVPKVTCEQYNGLQNAYNANAGDERWNQLLQNAATDPVMQQSLGNALNRARFIPSIGDWRSWHGNATRYYDVGSDTWRE